MPITITTPAIALGTYAITVAFLDENGDPATPKSGLTWKLTDTHGTVVHARSAVSIPPAAEVTVVLTGWIWS